MVAVSSAEAEYQATVSRVRETLWLRKLVGDLGLWSDAIEIRTDSQGAMSIGNNPITLVCSEYIDVQHHRVRERVSRREFALSYCLTDDIVAGVLTRALGEIKFRKCIMEMGWHCNSN
ncbi:hypothetical protein VaNZ11_008148 [Volvox africanus]|uniref:Reverse transcriptase Ty1/copia-type domain-containing protein n=1 Tax=Volvox africanus TaxID=51714 RepID=A0ABQ5S4C5_9CHLO|nr:hypothetical protein VaNZ11_008148 [Volvox africanus]